MIGMVLLDKISLSLYKVINKKVLVITSLYVFYCAMIVCT